MDILKQRKAGSGGLRPGAGRPKPGINQQIAKATAAAIKRYAKKYGKTLDEIALDMSYAVEEFSSITVAGRQKAMRFLDDRTRVAEGGETDHAPPGPAVYLPEMRPDEGKVVDIREVNDGDEESKD